VRLHTIPEVGVARAANQRVVDDSATLQLNTSSTLLIEQLFESTLILSALSLIFQLLLTGLPPHCFPSLLSITAFHHCFPSLLSITAFHHCFPSLLSITAFAHRIDFLAYF
jgi:hypothetical protein